MTTDPDLIKRLKEAREPSREAGASGRATHERNPQAVSAVPVGIPDAAAFVRMVSDWNSIPSLHFRQRYPFLEKLERQAMDDYKLGADELMVATLFAFTEIADDLYHAKAIEACKAETGTGSVHESAVGTADLPESDAPTPRPEAGEGVE